MTGSANANCAASLVSQVKDALHAMSKGNPTGEVRTLSGVLIPYLCRDDLQRLLGDPGPSRQLNSFVRRQLNILLLLAWVNCITNFSTHKVKNSSPQVIDSYLKLLLKEYDNAKERMVCFIMQIEN